jgi:hypothetical protein
VISSINTGKNMGYVCNVSSYGTALVTAIALARRKRGVTVGPVIRTISERLGHFKALG